MLISSFLKPGPPGNSFDRSARLGFPCFGQYPITFLLDEVPEVTSQLVCTNVTLLSLRYRTTAMGRLSSVAMASVHLKAGENNYFRDVSISNETFSIKKISNETNKIVEKNEKKMTCC